MTRTVQSLLSFLLVALATWALAGPALAEAFVGQDAPPAVQFVRSAAVVAEGMQRTTVAIAVSAPLAQDAEVTVFVRGGTATIGDDVTLDADPITLTFEADEAQPQVVTLTVNADEASEGIEFIDLGLRSDEVPVGTTRSFRLWIRDDALYPDHIADALTAQLRSDFAPSTRVAADAADSLINAIWAETGVTLGAFSHAANTEADQARQGDTVGTSRLVAGPVWPASSGAKARAYDAHVLVPMSEETRERRRAAFARAVDDAASAGAQLVEWAPRDELRGDVARALLYHQTLYPEPARASALQAMKSTLAQWMDDDPVDARELQRSTAIARRQGQPNPFVIAPELAEPAFNLRETYPTPTVSFAESGASIVESDSAAVLDVMVTGMGDEDVTLTVALDAAASTVDVEDVGGFRYRTVRFPAETPDGTTRRVRVPITHDEVDEDTERAVFTLQGVSGFARTGDRSQYTLDIENVRQVADDREARIVLGPAYPNPLGPGRGSIVRLEVSMDEALPFTVEVFSTLGQRVRLQRYSAGEAARLSTIEINTQDLPSGLYIVRLQGPSVNITETFVIVR
jgi:hypothetical protein